MRIREATLGDVEAMIRAPMASITGLCDPDHGNVKRPDPDGRHA